MATIGVLFTPEIREEIRAAIERARSHPTPWEVGRRYAVDSPSNTLTLEERGGKKPYRPHPPEEVILPPSGVRCCISFEEQPAGILRHLSISTRDGRRMIAPQMIAMITHEFGVDLPLERPGRVWVEEYEPGCHALNVVVLEVAREEGHA